jgi:hypothetical protein
LKRVTPFTDNVLAELKNTEFVTTIELVLKFVMLTVCVLRVRATALSADRRFAATARCGAFSSPLLPMLDMDQYIGMTLGPIIVLPEYDTSLKVREDVVSCRELSALCVVSPVSVKYDPAMDEIWRLPSALAIVAPDMSNRARVDAGPKLCMVRLDVVSALELVTFPLLIEGTVIGVERKFRNPVAYWITPRPRSILFLAERVFAVVTTVDARRAVRDPAAVTEDMTVERLKEAVAKVLSAWTVICWPRWPRILPWTLTFPPT